MAQVDPRSVAITDLLGMTQRSNKLTAAVPRPNQ